MKASFIFELKPKPNYKQNKSFVNEYNNKKIKQANRIAGFQRRHGFDGSVDSIFGMS
jgi:hypothetical protein